MGGLVGSAPVCYGVSSLGSNPDISQKYLMVMGDMRKGGANSSPPKNYTKKGSWDDLVGVVVDTFDQCVVVVL
jgi:hypothetical protein